METRKRAAVSSPNHARIPKKSINSVPGFDSEDKENVETGSNSFPETHQMDLVDETSIVAVDVPESFENVKTFVTPERVCILTEESIKLFDADGTSTATFRLDCSFQAASVSSDGRFLAVVDSIGTLHFIHLVSDMLMFSQQLISNGESYTVQAMEFGRAPSGTLCILANSNKLLVFSNIDTEKLHLALMKKDLEAAAAIRGQIKLLQIDTESLVKNALCFTAMLFHDGNAEILNLFFNNGHIIQVSVGGLIKRRSAVHSHEDLKQVFCKVDSTQKTFMIVLKTGKIELWDSRKLIQFNQLTFDNVEDAYCAKINGCWSLLFQVSGEGSQRIVSGTITSKRFRTNQLLQKSQECQVFGVAHHEEVSNFHVSYLINGKLFVTRLQDSTPTAKIQTLLSKNSFEEAENISKSHQIPVEPVWRAKLSYFQNQVNCENVNIVIDLLVKLRVAEFHENFLLDCCCDSVSTFDQLVRDSMSSVQLQTASLSALTKKLDTFLAIADDQLVDKFSVWKYFSVCPSHEIVCELLSKGEIVHAELFCARHADELSDDLSDIQKILDVIPVTASGKDLIHFLNSCIIDKLIAVKQSSWLFDWVVSRAALIEETFKRPNQSSEFVDAVLKIIESRKSLQQFLMTNGHPIKNLQKRLKTLVCLRNDFGFDLTLSELSVHGERAVSIMLLDRVEATDLFVEAVKCDFIPFCKYQELDHVNILGDYLIALLADCKKDDQFNVLSIVINCLDLMTNMDKRKEVLVELFCRVPVPWPLEFDQIIKETEEKFKNVSSSEQTDALTDQLQLLNLKKMLHRYSIVDFNFSDFNLASKALHYILATENENNQQVLEDAMLIVDKYPNVSEFETFITRMQNLASQRKSEQLKDIYSIIPDKIQKEITIQFLNWLVSLFERTSSRKTNARTSEKLLWISESILVIINFMDDTNSPFHQAAYLIRLKNTCLVFTQFNLVLNMKHWKSYYRRLKILCDFANTLNSSLIFDKADPSVSRLYQLSDLLQLEKKSFWAVLIKTALSRGAYENVLRLIHDRSLFSESKKSTYSVQINYEVIDELVVAAKHLSHNVCGSIYGNIMKELGQEMVLFSGPSDVVAVLDFWRKTECFSETIDKTSTGQYRSMMEMSSKQRFKIFPQQYDDDYLVFDIEEIISDLISVVKSGQPTRSDSGKVSFVSSALENITVLVDKLSDNRAYQLSGRWCDILCPLNQVYLETFNDTRNSILDKLVKKILTHNCIDSTLSFGYIISSPHKQAFEGIRLGMSGVNSEFRRLTEIAKIGGAAASVWQQRAFFVQLESLAKNSKWWEQFAIFEISFDENQFRHSEEYRQSFIPILLEKTAFDILTVASYADDYNIDLDAVYFNAIERVLIYESEREYENFITMCVLDIQNKQRYLELLKELQQVVSPYDFKKIKFIFQLILKEDGDDEIAKKGMSILDVLASYQRRAKPEAEELKSIAERVHQHDESLDISSFNLNNDKYLPYHELFIDPWMVIEKELNEENVDFFNAIAAPLGLVSDELYLLVIEKMLNDQSESSIHSKFAKIKNLMVKIKEPAMVYETWLKISTSSGMERFKTQSLGFAVNTAERLVRLARSAKKNDLLVEAESYLERAEKLLMIAEITDLLSGDNSMFETEKCMALVDSPKELIVELYQTFPFNPTNDVCFSIASCANLTITELQQELFDITMKSKLAPSNKARKVLLLSESVKEDEENTIRVLSYLLKSMTHENNFIQNLLQVAYDGSRKITTISRIRAIRTLFACYDRKEIDSVHSFTEIENYLSMLEYLLDCEDLRIVVSAKELAENSKSAFVKSLWMSRNNDFGVLTFALKLMLDFSMFNELDLWEHILKKVTTIGHANYLLTKFCNKICSTPELLRIENLHIIWHDLIIMYLDSFAEDGDDEHFNDALRLISTCPYMHYLTSEEARILAFAKKWSSSANSKLVLASVKLANHLMCLHLVPAKSVQQHLLGMMDHNISLKFVETVFDHYLNNQSLLNFLFDYLNDQGWHDVLLPRKDISMHYIKRLIETDKVHDLVQKLIEYGKEVEASHIATRYFKHYSPESEPVDALEAFFKLKS